ncbi:MAG: glycosyltransferase family 9 protein, partial [Pseudomonadota bacterium]
MSAIGDVTHVLPVVHTLRKTFPTTKLTWVIGKVEHKLVGHLPDVEFIVFDKSQGRSAYKKLKQDLNDRLFDVLLHMQVAMRANWASHQIRAKIKVGFDRKRSKDFHGFFLNNRIPPAKEQHQVDAFMSFLDVFGIEEKLYEWTLPIPDEAMEFANKHITTDKPLMVISPCSSHTLRNWVPERYGLLVN